MPNVVTAWRQINGMMLRPFQQEVDLETVVLVFALVLTASGAWHYVLERLEL